MIMHKLQPFHLAIPVNNLEETREFYSDFLGFEKARATNKWIDWNFFGHQVTTHLKPKEETDSSRPIHNKVDGHHVPVPHFGVVLPWQEWHDFADFLKKNNVKFVIDPYIRFSGEIGQQATMFFLDPSGNALEFKSFKDETQLFAKYE